MKKVPRPTASRMTRVWLPGRTTCSTACRSANEREKRSGCTAQMSATPAACSTSAVATKPPESIRPTGSDPACHAATPTSAAATAPVTPHLSQSMRPVCGTSLRSSSDGFTCRTSSSGTTENSSETSTPMASPCPTADALRP